MLLKSLRDENCHELCKRTIINEIIIDETVCRYFVHSSHILLENKIASLAINRLLKINISFNINMIYYT